jgi:hypothetical protein
MDSKRLLNFAIEQKMKLELKDSYLCIRNLCQGNTTVHKILEQKSLVNLTALCDFLTIMIRAMDNYQRENNKPTVAATNQSSQDSDIHEHGNSKKGQNGLKKDPTEHKKDPTEPTYEMEIDPAELIVLEEDFKNKKTNKFLAGMA